MRIGPKLILGFAGIGGVIALTAIIAVIPIKKELNELGEFHAPAMYLIQALSTESRSAVEEGFAYMASGEKSEKEEFFASIKKFDLQAEEFKKIANIGKPGEKEETALFEEIITNHAVLVKKAKLMFSEFEAIGFTSHKMIMEYEDTIDKLLPDLEKFIAIEKEEVAEAQREAAGIIKKSEKIIFAIGILAMILASGIGYFISRTISVPIAKLRDATVEIAKGNLSKRSEVGSRDEIGELAISFNRMTDEIQKRNEELLTINELRIKDIAIASSISGIAIADLAGNLNYVNDSFLKLWGYDNRHEVIGKSAFMFWDDPAQAQGAAEAIRQNGHWSGELNGKKKDGSIITIQLASNTIFDLTDKPFGIMASFLDISVSKRAEDALRKSEEQQQLILATLPIAIFTSPLDPEIDASWVSGDIEKITGFTIDQYMAEKDFWRNRLHADDRERVLAAYKNPTAGAEIVLEYRWLCKDGNYKWFHDRAIKKHTRQGMQYFGIILDITERKQDEEEIQRQLAEKGILLKEVHHRIKNNIASIGGLISLHMQSVSNPEAVAVLQEAIGRVDSMRILYDKLLITENYRDISVKNYAESLADAVLALFPDRAKIKLEKQIADFYLDPKQLFPLGLIINELITNKMKYAFIAREAGRITISLKNVAKHVTLDIRDNGNKLPAGFDIDKTKGFGLMLVKMLSQQLGGSFSIEKHKGTRCTVEFDI
jgi:PAS domain S-box-containing protein